jgi:hypothetical protein
MKIEKLLEMLWIAKQRKEAATEAFSQVVYAIGSKLGSGEFLCGRHKIDIIQSGSPRTYCVSVTEMVDVSNIDTDQKGTSDETTH